MAIEITSPMAGDKLKTELEKALDKTGDSMADGASLILGKMPEADMEAVPKKYVDNFADYLYKNTDLFIKRDEDGNVLYTDYKELMTESIPVFSVEGTVDPATYEFRYSISEPMQLYTIPCGDYIPFKENIIIGLFTRNVSSGSISSDIEGFCSFKVSIRDENENVLAVHEGGRETDHDSSRQDDKDLFYSEALQKSKVFTIDNREALNEKVYLWLDELSWTVETMNHKCKECKLSLDLRNVKLSVEDRWKMNFGKTVV